MKIRPKLYSYIAGILKAKKCACCNIGGTSDHIHILCDVPKTMSSSDLIKEIKMSSSLWIKTQHGNFSPFHWQAGYGSFSVSSAHVKALRVHIENQEKHHHQTNFQDEFLRLLQINNVKYNEKYLWD
jgi:REP element-mobilizing transposase RayT